MKKDPSGVERRKIKVSPTTIFLKLKAKWIVTDLVDVLVGLDEVDAEFAQGCGGRVSEVLGDARLHGLNVRRGVRTCQLLLVHQPPVQHRMSPANTHALSSCNKPKQHLVRNPLNLSSYATFICHFYLLGALNFIQNHYKMLRT